MYRMYSAERQKINVENDSFTLFPYDLHLKTEILLFVQVTKCNKRHNITCWFLLLSLMMSAPISFCLFTFCCCFFFFALNLFFLLRFNAMCYMSWRWWWWWKKAEEQTVISLFFFPSSLVFTDFYLKCTNVHICIIINIHKLYILFQTSILLLILFFFFKSFCCCWFYCW